MTSNEYPKIVPSPTGRFYQISPNPKHIVPSASTVPSFGLPIQPYLLKWKIQKSGGDYDKYLNIQNSASRIGSAVHLLIEHFLLGEVIDLSSEDISTYCNTDGVDFPGDAVTQIRNGFRSFEAFWTHHKPTLISTEQVVYCTAENPDGSLVFPWCGQVDIVCEINGVRYMLDVKTSKQVRDVLAYNVQLNIYRALYNSTADVPIERQGVLWAKKDFLRKEPPKSVLDIYEYPTDEQLMWETTRMFHRVYKGFRPDVIANKTQVPLVFERSV